MDLDAFHAELQDFVVGAGLEGSFRKGVSTLCLTSCADGPPDIPEDGEDVAVGPDQSAKRQRI